MVSGLASLNLNLGPLKPEPLDSRFTSHNSQFTPLILLLMLMLVLVLVIAIGSALWLPLFAPHFKLLVSTTPFTIFDMIPLSRPVSLAKMFGVASCRPAALAKAFGVARRRRRTAKTDASPCPVFTKAKLKMNLFNKRNPAAFP